MLPLGGNKTKKSIRNVGKLEGNFDHVPFQGNVALFPALGLIISWPKRIISLHLYVLCITCNASRLNENGFKLFSFILHCKSLDSRKGFLQEFSIFSVLHNLFYKNRIEFSQICWWESLPKGILKSLLNFYSWSGIHFTLFSLPSS